MPGLREEEDDPPQARVPVTIPPVPVAAIDVAIARLLWDNQFPVMATTWASYIHGQQALLYSEDTVELEA